MIASQRPMMLEAAMGLSQLVKEQTDMTWNNTDQVQRYIVKLKQHVEQVTLLFSNIYTIYYFQ